MNPIAAATSSGLF